ncbi:serine/threonine kinase [Aureococcus anophagefferens]|nr:serine/threonine kinase [Aureococcus anophagefferens]
MLNCHIFAETRLKRGIGRGRLVLRGRRRRHRAMGNTCCNGAGGQVGNNSRVVTHSKSARANIMRQREEDIGQYYDIEATIGRGSIGTVARAQHKESKKCGGDLYKRAPYGERNAGRYVSADVRTRQHMHRFNAVHRDLKFENVLFMSKAPESEVMIIDFGLAKANYARKKKLDEFGTIYRRAAKGFERERYDMTRRTMAKRSEDKAFVKYLLKAKVDQRPDMQQVLKHKWLKGRTRDYEAAANPKSLGDDGVATDEDMVDNLKKYVREPPAAHRPHGHRPPQRQRLARELRAAFRAIDTANEGFINFGELEAVLTKAGYDQALIAEVFEAVDHDNTGRISYTEFLAAMLEGNCLVQEDELATRSTASTATTGAITKDNLRQLLGTSSPRPSSRR